jgi:hypothetical protein
MGFMDKAKKMAEQAQAKLDEAQKNFNQGQQGGQQQSGGPAVEYDKHGRPVNSAADAPPAPEPSAPPAGDPLAEPAAATPTPTPEPTDSRPHGDPLLDDEPGSRQGADAEREAAQPKPPAGGQGMTSGDPLG